MLNKRHHLPHNPGNTEKQGVASKRSLPDQGEGSVEGEPRPMAFGFKIENEWGKHRQDKKLLFWCVGTNKIMWARLAKAKQNRTKKTGLKRPSAQMITSWSKIKRVDKTLRNERAAKPRGEKYPFIEHTPILLFLGVAYWWVSSQKFRKGREITDWRLLTGVAFGWEGILLERVVCDEKGEYCDEWENVALIIIECSHSETAVGRVKKGRNEQQTEKNGNVQSPSILYHQEFSIRNVGETFDQNGEGIRRNTKKICNRLKWLIHYSSFSQYLGNSLSTRSLFIYSYLLPGTLWRDRLTRPEEGKNVQNKESKAWGKCLHRKGAAEYLFQKTLWKQIDPYRGLRKRSRGVQGSGERVWKNLGLPFCVRLKENGADRMKTDEEIRWEEEVRQPEGINYTKRRVVFNAVCGEKERERFQRCVIKLDRIFESK